MIVICVIKLDARGKEALREPVTDGRKDTQNQKTVTYAAF